MLGISIKNHFLNLYNSLWCQQFLILFLKHGSERTVQPRVTQLESGLSHAQTQAHATPFPLPMLSSLEEESPIETVPGRPHPIEVSWWAQVSCLLRARRVLCCWPQSWIRLSLLGAPVELNTNGGSGDYLRWMLQGQPGSSCPFSAGISWLGLRQ